MDARELRRLAAVVAGVALAILVVALVAPGESDIIPGKGIAGCGPDGTWECPNLMPGGSGGEAAEEEPTSYPSGYLGAVTGYTEVVPNTVTVHQQQQTPPSQSVTNDVSSQDLMYEKEFTKCYIRGWGC